MDATLAPIPAVRGVLWRLAPRTTIAPVGCQLQMPLMISSSRDTGGVSLVTAERNPEHAGGAGSLHTCEPCRISLVTADTVPGVLALPRRVPSLGRAVEQFLAAKPLSANGRRSYAHTLGTVVGDLGADLALDEFTAERLRRVLEDRWGDASAATWNNRLTAVGSFRRWVQHQGWIAEDPLAGIERRPQPRDDTAAIRYDQLHALWTRPDVHVREKTLWRMLYETAARANEILALNIEDLDLGARRAEVRGKGGHRQEVVWASGTARLLPRHLGGRQRGPLFVTHRRPNQAPALPDLCPDTGRGRLSYQQAWALFRNASDWTLHQLRHSALTHLGERGVGAPLLKAKSRHRSLRSLDRYVHPGIEAVAALTRASTIRDVGTRPRVSRLPRPQTGPAPSG